MKNRLVLGLMAAVLATGVFAQSKPTNSVVIQLVRDELKRDKDDYAKAVNAGVPVDMPPGSVRIDKVEVKDMLVSGSEAEAIVVIYGTYVGPEIRVGECQTHFPFRQIPNVGCERNVQRSREIVAYLQKWESGWKMVRLNWTWREK